MASNTRRWLLHLQIWAGLAVGVTALYLAARSFDVEALGQALRQVRLPLLALTLVTSLLTPVLKARRWRWLFYPERPPLNILQLASLVVIGQAINFMIPGRWGELVRAYLAGEECRISKWFTLGTLAAEKLLDLVILAILVVALIPFVVLPEALAGQVEVVVLTALAVTITAATLLGGRAFWLKLAGTALRILPPAAAGRWYQRIQAGLDGLAALGNRRAALAVWGWSGAFWLTAATTNLLLLIAFDLPASPVMALVLLAVLQGGVAVPSTPGKIGVFQLLCVLGLSVFGVPEATGLAYGLVLHVLVVGGVTVWAALVLWARSLNLSRLAREAQEWGK